MRTFSFICLLTLLVSACGKTLETREETDFLGNKLVYTVDAETGLKEGEYRRYDVGGSLVEIANYENDMLSGTRILFSVVGDTQVVETYAIVEGEEGAPVSIFSGPYTAYFTEDNLIKQRGQYVDNEMAGVWTFYYESGEPKEAVTFAGNEENGPFREWNEAGVLRAEGSYRNGEFEDGQLRLYDENGDLRRVMHCELGVCTTRWKPEDEFAPPPREIAEL